MGGMTNKATAAADEAPSYRVFPNGTSHMVWRDANCDQCWKSRVNEKTGKSHCGIEYAIALASATDGTFLAGGNRKPRQAASLATRLDWDGKSYLETDCPEREEKRPRYPKKRSPGDMALFKLE